MTASAKPVRMVRTLRYIMPFDTEEDAVQFANDSDYGLSGSLWTRDIGRTLRVARAVETGMLSINSSSSVHIEAPFGV